jgi:cell wall-associated NlpC family hydrolase
MMRGNFCGVMSMATAPARNAGAELWANERTVAKNASRVTVKKELSANRMSRLRAVATRCFPIRVFADRAACRCERGRSWFRRSGSLRSPVRVVAFSMRVFLIHLIAAGCLVSSGITQAPAKRAPDAKSSPAAVTTKSDSEKSKKSAKKSSPTPAESPSELTVPKSDTAKSDAPQSGAANAKKPDKKAAAVSSILPEEIEGFDSYPADVQKMLRIALPLTTQNLRYQFGSSDPKAGGMDCSGTVFRVLTDYGIKNVPRQSDEICRWVMQRTVLFRTEDATSLKDPAFSALKPGDLLFWTGTYETSAPRELPISHVMIYLGKRKKDGKPVVFGASDGRTYDNERRNGVSVFDFALPKRGNKSEFYGYGRVPGLGDAG